MHYYSTKLTEFKLEETKSKFTDRLYAYARLTIFVASAILLYYFLSTQVYWFLTLTLLGFSLYGLVSIIDSKHYLALTQIQRTIKLIQIELAYLNGVKLDLIDGQQYLDPHHEYCYDLDIFGANSLFQSLNRCISVEGQDKLAHDLKYKLTHSEDILKRQEMIAELTKHSDWRIIYGAIPDRILDASTLLNLCDQQKDTDIDQLSAKSTVVFAYIYSFLCGIVVLLSLLNYLPSFCIGLALVSQLIIVSIKESKLHKIAFKVDGLHKNFKQYERILEHFKGLKVQSIGLQYLQDTLFNNENNPIVAFKGITKLMGALDRRNNIYATLFCNSLFMLDLHTIRNYQLWMQKHKNYIKHWVDCLAELDVLYSLATFSFNHPEFIAPEPCFNVLLDTKKLGHPLIKKEQLVCNDFIVTKKQFFSIITGANMAGKSTFLRTIGVNLVLANMGAVVSASSFKFTPMQVFSSMRTSDILAEGTSYFKAELLRLQQMLHCIKQHDITFIILDEILKGTNSVDKLKGSQLFLEKLIGLACSGLIATHDLALGNMDQIYPKHINNHCFEIQENELGIHYDYQLREGISKNMNATQLIQQMLLNE